MPPARLLSCAIAAVLAAPAAAPHVDTVSFARFTLGGEQIELELEVDTDHLMQVAEAPPPQGLDWSEEEIRGIEQAACGYLAAHWQLQIDGLPERWIPRGFERLMAFDPLLQQERAIRVVFRFLLPAPRHDASAVLVQALFEGVELAHRHVIVVEAPGREQLELVAPARTPVSFLLEDVAPGSLARRLRSRAVAGAATALAAPWLVLFLVALLAAPLPARERALAALVALATTILAATLAAATWIAPAPWAATAAAALSVAYVAAENRFARNLSLRTATAALFGLVHGMALPPRLPDSALPPTPSEQLAFLGAALLVAIATALAATFLTRMLRAFADRPFRAAFDAALLLAGAIGFVTAIVSRA